MKAGLLDEKSSFGYYGLSFFHRQLVAISGFLGYGWFGRWLALSCRKLVLSTLKTPIIDATVTQLKVRFYPNDNITDRVFLFMPGYFDRTEWLFMHKILESNSTFIDIGANSGIYSLRAAQLISHGQILAYEPNPVMAKRLTYNVRANKLSDVIKVKPHGIADQEKEFEMTINPADFGSNTIINKTSKAAGKVSIRCRTLLDSLVDAGIERVDLLKIDIEQAEHLALNPFFETVANHLFPKHIIIETADQVPLENYGYVKMATTRSHNSIYSLRL